MWQCPCTDCRLERSRDRPMSIPECDISTTYITHSVQIRTIQCCIINIRRSKLCASVYLNAERRLSILYLDKVLICELGMVDKTHRVIVGRDRH
jgi:hypothetical protein